LSPASSVSSFNGSHGSGSTYYVMPTGRQKVHVIVSPSTSVAYPLSGRGLMHIFFAAYH
jgi:hypothetical protein